jgi:hypothetical protein
MISQVGYSVAGRSKGRATLCAVCTVNVETMSVGFLVEPQNQCQWFVSGLASKPLGWFSPVWPQNRWLGFPGLVIWASKSPRRFLSLGFKTKQALVCRLHHKTDGGRTTWDTHRDLAACFIWKQVALGFSNLVLRLAEA